MALDEENHSQGCFSPKPFFDHFFFNAPKKSTDVPWRLCNVSFNPRTLYRALCCKEIKTPIHIPENASQDSKVDSDVPVETGQKD